MLKFLKEILPHSLFRRFLLIILLPNIIVQLVAIYVFYERHWSGVSKRMVSSLVGEVELIVQGIEHSSGQERQNFINLVKNSSLDLGVKLIPNSNIHEAILPRKFHFRMLRDE